MADQSSPGPGVPEDGVIVVGVDGSDGSAAALEFALDQGQRHGARVLVVTAWLGSGPLEGAMASDDVAEGRERVQRMQEKLVARGLAARPRAPEPGRIVVHDYAGRVLVARAERASMVVVGSGSPNSVNHQLLGSVAEYCLRHSRVPVVIVPAPARLERRASGAETQAG